jgi:hypothetical protein
VEEFRAERGHTQIPVAYRLPDGRCLGNWISQRRRDFREGKLAADEVAMLAEVGVDVRVDGAAARRRTWTARTEEPWRQRVAELIAFRDEFGHPDVPQSYVTPDGFGLGRWLSRCRAAYRDGTLPAEREQELTALGVELDLEIARWLYCLGALAAFRAEHGHGNVPAQYRTADGYMLGDWLRRCRDARRAGRLGENRIAALVALGVDFDLSRADESAARWNAWLADLATYRQQHGQVNVPATYVTPEGRQLGSWLAKCRTTYRKGTLPPPRVADLVGLGVNLNLQATNVGRNPRQAWDSWIQELESYRTTYGTAEVPEDYITPFGAKLGDWLRRCKTAARQGTLPAERRRQLRKLGITVPKRNSVIKQHTPQARRARWKLGIAALRGYASEYGHANPPATYVAPGGYRLGSWLAKRREEYRAGRLSDQQEAELRALGVRMDPGSNKGESWQAHAQRRWDDWMRLLVDYRAEHGDVHVACSYRTPDGRPLGTWLSNCRRRYREGRLPADRIAELTAAGVDFDTNGRGSLDDRWVEWVQALTEYRDEHGIFPPSTYHTPDGRPVGQWLAARRTDYRKDRLRPDRIAELQALGVEFGGRRSGG